jgi:hypothetical protein
MAKMDTGKELTTRFHGELLRPRRKDAFDRPLPTEAESVGILETGVVPCALAAPSMAHDLMPARIEDYALIGDWQAAALVARDGLALAPALRPSPRFSARPTMVRSFPGSGAPRTGSGPSLVRIHCSCGPPCRCGAKPHDGGRVRCAPNDPPRDRTLVPTDRA